MTLIQRALAHDWYHTLELAPGQVTDGVFDMRPYVERYGIPQRMEGMRVLEVGSWDGFWAFEMERRGAAEVVALDLDDEREQDWPPRRRPEPLSPTRRGEGFEMAKELLGSRAQRVVCNIYDADPADLGTFDVVLCGMVLIHLRDQLLALERIARLCRGLFISAEEYDPVAGMMPVSCARYRADRDASVVYWCPSRRLWRRMMWTAGFDRVRSHERFRVRANPGYVVRHVVHHASGSLIAGQAVPSPRRTTVRDAPPRRHDPAAVPAGQ